MKASYLSAAGPKITVRKARTGDADQFITLVNELANYEKLSPPGRKEIRRLRRDAFGKNRKFELVMGFAGSRAVAYAVYFMTYSTFLAKPTLYLEDIFVLPEFRRAGVGTAIFSILGETAARRRCGRMEWSVLKWNEMALNFYGKIGAKELSEWTYFRMTEDNFSRLIRAGKTGRRALTQG